MMGKLIERPAKAQSAAIPPLRDGDMLDTNEFFRRYEAMGEDYQAELLDGVVWITRWPETDDEGRTRIMPPISGFHAKPNNQLVTLFNLYADETDGVIASGTRTVVLNGVKSACEPDGMMFLDYDCGGSAKEGPKGWLYGQPELILEVANTTVHKDLGTKRHDYERYGVQEYIVWQTQEKLIHWFSRVKGEYQLQRPERKGIISSKVFPTFSLDIPALLEGRWKDCRRELERSMASPEHAKFVEKLRRAKAKKK